MPNRTNTPTPRALRHVATALATVGLLGLVGSAAAQTAGPPIPKAPAGVAPKPATPKPAAKPAARPKVVRKAAPKARTTPVRRVTKAAPRRTVSKAATASGFGQGSRGDKVLAVQIRLAELKYDITNPDGAFGDQTYHAVMAFQKVNGLSRTGRVNTATLTALETAVDPAPLLTTGGADRIEVDLTKQYLAMYKGGALTKLLSVSSGNGKKFCVYDPETKKTECDEAVTPGGSFRVRSRWVGWRESKLGLLYNPLYFNGGIAIHGAPSVPSTPASHGCVRIPMISAEWFPTEVNDGMPVYVFGAKEAPVPLKATAPANAKTTPTTTPGVLPTIPSSGVAAPTAPGTPTTTIGAAPLVSSTTTTAIPTTTAAPTTTGIIRILNPLGTPTVATTTPPVGGSVVVITAVGNATTLASSTTVAGSPIVTAIGGVSTTTIGGVVVTQVASANQTTTTTTGGTPIVTAVTNNSTTTTTTPRTP
jgi:peptidoglycan hydrolase-like protein with peptidoglycan-binding domain